MSSSNTNTDAFFLNMERLDLSTFIFLSVFLQKILHTFRLVNLMSSHESCNANPT